MADELPPPTTSQTESGGEPVVKPIQYREQIVAIAGGALAVLAAFLPWATAANGLLSKSGIDGDGAITLLLGTVGALAAWQAGRLIWVAVICGALVALIGVVDYIDIAGETLVSAGAGLILTIIAGVALFAGALTTWDKQRRA